MGRPPAYGSLLIRAWVDEGRLKARVMQLLGDDAESLNVVGTEELLASIQRWIEELAASGGAEPA